MSSTIAVEQPTEILNTTGTTGAPPAPIALAEQLDKLAATLRKGCQEGFAEPSAIKLYRNGAVIVEGDLSTILQWCKLSEDVQIGRIGDGDETGGREGDVQMTGMFDGQSWLLRTWAYE